MLPWHGPGIIKKEIYRTPTNAKRPTTENFIEVDRERLGLANGCCISDRSQLYHSVLTVSQRLVVNSISGSLTVGFSRRIGVPERLE